MYRSLKVSTRGRRMIHGQTRYDNASFNGADDEEGTFSRFFVVFTVVEKVEDDEDEVGAAFSSSDLLNSL